MSQSVVEIRPLREGDIEALLANMRQPDRDEVEAAGQDVENGVISSVQMSAMCWAAEINGRLACLFGVAPISLLGGVGAPWLLGTDVLDRHPRALIRNTGPYLDAMRSAFPHLVNYVDARNTRSIRWLKALGFRFQPAQPYGPRGFAFHRFEMES